MNRRALCTHPAVGFFGYAMAVQYPLPGFEELSPAVFYCTNNIEILLWGKCVGVILGNDRS